MGAENVAFQKLFLLFLGKQVIVYLQNAQIRKIGLMKSLYIDVVGFFLIIKYVPQFK